MKVTYLAKAEESVDNILRKRLKMSHRVIKENENRVFVNGVHFNRRDIVGIGDKVEIELIQDIPIDERFINKYKCTSQKLDIIYEDDYILAVNKSAGMPVHPSINNYTNTLSNIVAPYLAKQENYGIHIITRLDKDTSGVCIFAKHPYIQELFNINKEKMNIKKEYIAVVNGMTEKHQIIEKTIGRKDDTIILREVRDDGKYAKTEYEQILYDAKENYSVARVKLYTGRTHQIRVHMSYVGHTLLGDDLYAKEYEKEDILKLISRQALHCEKISFVHPITQCDISIKAKLPKDMLILCKSCGAKS